MKCTFPWSKSIPREPEGLLYWRMEWLKYGSESKEHGRIAWEMCKQDPIFFVITFMWTYNPKIADGPKHIPFFLYDFQVQALKELVESFGVENICIEKSREMGASWLLLAIFFWAWRFYDDQTFLLVSRKEDYVDKSDFPDSLFWKLDFINNNLPSFLTYKAGQQERSLMKFANRETNSFLNGQATTGDMGRGGRGTAALIDEFSAFDPPATGWKALDATERYSDCRIFNFTPVCNTDAASAIAKMKGVRKIRMYWPDHPEKGAGLYQYVKGQLVKYDPGYKYIIPEGAPHYPYVKDGKLRSPAYDLAESRSPDPTSMAREWDIDYGGASYIFFHPAKMAQARRDNVRPPDFEGELEIDPFERKVTGITPCKGGPFRVWQRMQTHEGWTPSMDREYVIGADIGCGTGATASPISVGDCKERRKVAEYVRGDKSPEECAVYADCLSDFFRDENNNRASVIWEDNGPGKQFRKRFMERVRCRIYYRKNEKSANRDETKYPGFWTDRNTKRPLLAEFRDAVQEREFVVCSEETYEEAMHYIVTELAVEHDGASSSRDPNGAGENHGDRVIADALCWHFMLEINKGMIPDDVPASDSAEPPEGSVAWRHKLAEQEQ